MATNELYIPFYNLNNVFLDKDTGLPLSGGKVYFFQDSQRLNPKPVYQITGTSPNYMYTALDNPLILSISGTFVDTNGNPIVVYGYPFDASGNVDYYYIAIYSAGDVLQEEIELCPYIPAGTVTPEGKENTDNELSNPQFVEVSFDSLSSQTYTVSGLTETSIAPDWLIISGGSGTFTVSRTEPTATTSPTNPPYALQIEADAGLGSYVTLRQLLNNSPRLGSGKYASASCVAALSGVGDGTITINYVRSGGTPTDIQLASVAITPDGTFQLVQGNAAIGQTFSSDPASTGYVAIDILIPTARIFQITSVQLVIISAAGNIPFDESSVSRQVDQLFHVWKSPLSYKPIESYLVGWDFLMNPAQERGKTLNITSTPEYIMDQTIAYSTDTCSMGPVPEGVQVITTANNNAFYFLQYLEYEARDMINTSLSVNVNAIADGTSGEVKVYLFRAGVGDVFPALPATIGALASDGVFTLTEPGWTEIPRGGLSTATSALSTSYTITNNFNSSDIGFNGWQIPFPEFYDTAKFAIVVTFATLNAGDSILINSISCVPGFIPTRPAPKTFAQTLQDCQYYYEKSYDNTTYAGTATYVGVCRYPITTWLSTITPLPPTPDSVIEYYFNRGRFQIDFNTVKRVIPGVSLYDPAFGGGPAVQWGFSYGNTYITPSSGTNPLIDDLISAVDSSTKRATFVSTTSDNATFARYGLLVSGVISNVPCFDVHVAFHYVADARIGKI